MARATQYTIGWCMIAIAIIGYFWRLPRTGHPPRHLRRFYSIRFPGSSGDVFLLSLLAEKSAAR